MRIQSNISAINTQRQMFKVNNAQAKSLEKLSSGFRINRAADDAAGLAISEKMRSQIRGMKQASRNAQDGISVVQTAEGALDEVHSMLQRMKELAVQSANDSNQSVVDREALQMEVDALTDEINSITNKTQFNKMNLLDGSFQNKHFHVGPNENQTIGISIKSMTAVGLGLNVGGDQEIRGAQTPTVIKTAAGKLEGKPATAISAGKTISMEGFSSFGAKDGQNNSLKIDVEINNTKHSVEVTSDDRDGKKVTQLVADKINEVLGEGTVKASGSGIKLLRDVEGLDVFTKAKINISVGHLATGITKDSALSPFVGSSVGIAGISGTITEKEAVMFVDYSLSRTDRTFKFNIDGKDYTVDIKASTSMADAKNLISAALGNAANVSNVNSAFRISSVSKGKAASIQLEATGVQPAKIVHYQGVNILTRQTANASMKNIQTAIETLSFRRSELGAIQNRIEHTIANLDNSHENLKAAEARVRDTDMAKEIIESTRTSILSQAAISMLAQANQVPQNVLSLLR